LSSPVSAADTPITDRQQLIASLSAGEKPVSAWRIGTEHEKFGFRRDDLLPPAYEGERGIGALLQGLTRFGWAPVIENGFLIALTRDAASVSLEPAGSWNCPARRWPIPCHRPRDRCPSGRSGPGRRADGPGLCRHRFPAAVDA
jgi:Gamma-glutamylcysteine synthetase